MAIRSFFLSLHADGFSSTSSGLGVLTSDFESPLVSKTAVGSHLEKPFDVFSELGFKDVGSHLEILSFLVIAESVQEPSRNSLSFGVGDDVGDFVALLLVKLSGSDPGVDSEDLADEETESPADTLDLFQSIGDSSLSINVGVQDTMNVLEISFCVFDDE